MATECVPEPPGFPPNRLTSRGERHDMDFQRSLPSAAVVLLTSFLAIPAARAEQPVDFTACMTSTLTMLSSGDGINVFGVESKVIVVSNPEGKLFHNYTYQFTGVGYGPPGTPVGFGYFKITDPDDSYVIAEFIGPTTDLSFKFLQGTGKWKGVTGGGKAVRVAVGRPIAPGTLQGCVRFTGTLDLKK